MIDQRLLPKVGVRWVLSPARALEEDERLGLQQLWTLAQSVLLSERNEEGVSAVSHLGEVQKM